uniref:Ig-like domain-containing protein n=1 Tax=Scleropages formosus TaxID=113540 RepID=A0A8C9VKT4_SCLFO
MGNGYCLSLLSLCPAGLGPSSAQSGGQQVQGIMGESFKFPIPVFNTGSLSYGNLGNIVMVVGGTAALNLKENFRDRLQWDKQTGFFTITELKLQDEGQYKVDNSDGQKILTTFQLTVYSRFSFSLQYLLLSKPTVDTQNCSVLCSVENDRDVTLSWTREKEILNKTSSPHLKTTLSLRLDIEKHPETYYCEAKNPVSSERLRVDSEEHCAPTAGGHLDFSAKSDTVIIIFCVMLMLRDLFLIHCIGTDDSKRSSIVAGSVIGALLALGILAGVAYCLKKKPSPRAEGRYYRCKFHSIMHICVLCD